MTDPFEQKVHKEPHVGPIDKPEVQFDQNVARLFLSTPRAGFQHLATVFRGFYSKFWSRDDRREGKQLSLQDCETSMRGCQGSACQDILTAQAAVGLVSQWFPGCDTNYRLETKPRCAYCRGHRTSSRKDEISSPTCQRCQCKFPRDTHSIPRQWRQSLPIPSAIADLQREHI